MSCTARTVPLTVPVTLDRPDRSRYSTGTFRTRCPACTARSTISSGHPERRSVIPKSRRTSRRIARIGPRSSRRSRVRRRTSKASTLLARRACGGHAPRSAMRLPITRSASPCSTYATTSGRARGSSDASQSMKQTTSLVAACSPAQHAAPKPCCSSRTTRAPCSRAKSAVRSVDPLSTTIGRYPSGILDSTHGIAAASFNAGRITSGTRQRLRVSESDLGDGQTTSEVDGTPVA